MPQVFFPITPVEIVPVTSPSLNWAVLDLSAWLPVGATGAIVYIFNGDGSAKPWGIRKNGSVNNFQADCSGNMHCWGIVGVDADRKIQFYNVYAFPGKIGLWLIGYTMAGVTMFTNAVAYGTPGLAAWGDIDLSASVPAGAVGVIVQVFLMSAGHNWGLRMNGSGDNRVSISGNRMNQFTAVIGCDDVTRIIQGYRSNVAVQFQLLGYVTAGATFYLNAVDMTPAFIGAYRTCPNLVPVNGVLAFIEADTGGNPMSLRGYDVGFPPNLRTNIHFWGIVRPNTAREIQAAKAGAASTFSMTGYAHYMPPTVQTLPATGVT